MLKIWKYVYEKKKGRKYTSGEDRGWGWKYVDPPTTNSKDGRSHQHYFLDSTALIEILTTEAQIITDSQCRQYEYKMRLKKGEKGTNIKENGSGWKYVDPPAEQQ